MLQQACSTWTSTAAVRGLDNSTLFNLAIGDARTDLMSSRILRTGAWEIRHPQQLATLADASLEPFRGSSNRHVFLDIGANIGYYSLLFAHFGYRSIAIEPMARNLAAINASLCRSSRLSSRISVVPSAAGGSRVGTERCIIRTRRGVRNNRGNGVLRCGTPGRAGLHTCAAADDAHTCHEVRLRTVDDVLAELRLPRVDVVKIDIEGTECQALPGMRGLLSRYRPTFVQWEGKTRAVDTCMRAALRGYGYRIGNKCAGEDLNTVASLAPPIDGSPPGCAPCAQQACGCCPPELRRTYAGSTYAPLLLITGRRGSPAQERERGAG